MDLRGKLKADVEDFKRGWSEAGEEGFGRASDDSAAGVPIVPWPALELALVCLLELFRVVLFGFLIASPGVPLVPWGHGPGITVALVAAAAAIVARFHRDEWLGIAALVVVLGCIQLVAFTEVSSASMLVAGAMVSVVVHIASSRAFVYGLVAAMALLSVVVKVLDLRPLPVDELITGGPWTPDGAGRQGLLLAALVFINAMFHLNKADLARQRAKTAEAEQARDAAVVSERARIARELHDVVSHHVTAMTLQAEAAAFTGDAGALQTVASSGREALTELRRMLGVLRQPEPVPGERAHSATEPQPGLDDLDALARRSTSGVAVGIERQGDVRALPAGVELCAYRLVQESITNSSKHGDARQVRVKLVYGKDDLTIEVLDDGRPLAHARVGSGGHGLVGMSERVALLDGELSTGPRADGQGYRVLARLPLQG